MPFSQKLGCKDSEYFLIASKKTKKNDNVISTPECKVIL
jgi:hypothetical protein